MSSLQAALAGLLFLVTCGTLVGLLARGRYRLCWSFALYLVTLVVVNRLVTWWPATFFTADFWRLKQTLYVLLRLTIAIEITALAFRRFVGVHPLVRGTFLFLLLTTLLGLFTIPGSGAFADFLGHTQPRAAVGTAWLFTATTVVAGWYRIPLHAFHRALLAGFVVSLLLSALLTLPVGWLGFGSMLEHLVSYADQLLACAVMGYWCHAAWRAETVVAVSPALVRELQPWR